MQSFRDYILLDASTSSASSNLLRDSVVTETSVTNTVLSFLSLRRMRQLASQSLNAGNIIFNRKFLSITFLLVAILFTSSVFIYFLKKQQFTSRQKATPARLRQNDSEIYLNFHGYPLTRRLIVSDRSDKITMNALTYKTNDGEALNTHNSIYTDELFIAENLRVDLIDVIRDQVPLPQHNRIYRIGLLTYCAIAEIDEGRVSVISQKIKINDGIFTIPLDTNVATYMAKELRHDSENLDKNQRIFLTILDAVSSIK